MSELRAKLIAEIRNNVQVTVHPEDDGAYDYEVDVDDAADSVLALLGTADWQPIETAPKDGTPFLAYCPREKQPYRVLKWATFCDEDPDGEWIEAGDREYAFEEDAFFHPAHWQSLKPPEQPKGKLGHSIAVNPPR